MDLILDIRCLQHQEQIEFLDLHQGVQKGLRALCKKCKLYDPTHLSEALQIWREYEQKVVSNLKQQHKTLIEPWKSLEEQFEVIKKALNTSIDSTISIFKYFQQEIQTAEEQSLQNIKDLNLITSLSKLQDIADIIGEKKKIENCDLIELSWMNGYAIRFQEGVQKLNRIARGLNQCIYLLDNMATKKKEHKFLLNSCYSIIQNNISQNQSQLAEALSLFNQATQIYPRNWELTFKKGQILDSLFLHEEAVQSFDESIIINPQSDVFFNKGIALQNLNKNLEAIECYNNAISLNSMNSNAYFNKGVALQNLGRNEEALICYSEKHGLIKVEHYLIQTDLRKQLFVMKKLIIFRRIMLMPAIGQEMPQENQIVIKKPYKIMIRRYHTILNQLKPIITKGLHYFIQINLQRLQSVMMKPQGSIQNILKQSVIKLGNALRKMNQNEEAIKFYDQAISISPKYNEAFYNKGVALQNIGLFNEAIECYDEAISINPKNADALYNKGLALRKINRTEEALKCYDQAIAVNSQYFEAFYNKGVALQELNKNEEAIKCYYEAIKINSNDPQAFFNRGVALENMKRYKEAIKCYDQAININPQYTKAYSNKAIALKKLSCFKEAAICEEQVVKIQNSPLRKISNEQN